MNRFHVNPQTGNTGECRAVYECPFGEENHYDSLEEARDAYEASMSSNSLVALAKRDLRDESLIGQFPYGDLELNGISFERDRNSYDAAYYHGASEIFGGQETAYFGFDDKKAWFVASFDKERETIAEVTFESQDYDSDGTVTPRALAYAFESSMDKAKEKFPDVFDQDSRSHVQLKEMYNNLNDGTVSLDGIELERTGWGAPDVWEAPLTDRPGFNEIYVRSRHGVATAYLVQNNGERITIAQETHDDGNWDSLSRARFFARANDAFISNTF